MCNMNSTVIIQGVLLKKCKYSLLQKPSSHYEQNFFKNVSLSSTYTVSPDGTDKGKKSY